MFRALRLCLLAACALPGLARAQTIRGDVTEEPTGRPVAGALVLLLGAGDSTSRSAPTTDRGTFVITAAAAGTYRLRVLRIGYRAWTSSSLELLPGQDRIEHLAISAVPVVLGEIVVRASSPCRADPDASPEVAVLWEEARKGLRLAGRSVEFAQFKYRSRLLTRRLNSLGLLAGQEEHVRIGVGVWPVTSLPADSLAAAGYVQPGDLLNGPRYYGPDAGVFFSESFLRTHCFKPVVAREHDSPLLGIGFQPTEHRPVPDISGVLWLDRRTAELRSLAFSYTGLSGWVPKGKAGGEVVFVRLDSGAWIISRWLLRAPIARTMPPERGRMVDDETFRLFGPKAVALEGFVEQEGLVEEVVGSDSTVVWMRAASP